MFDSKFLIEQFKEYNRWLVMGRVTFSLDQNEFPIYHLMNENPLMELPSVSKESDTVVIIFTGGGSINSSGSGLYRLINRLGKIGISAVALDYPFHGQGARDQKFYDREYFYNYIYTFIQRYINQNKSVILLGQSFGTLVIDRLLYRFPELKIKGAVLAAPGGPLTQALGEHYHQIKSNGQFDSYIAEQKIDLNEDGQKWMWHILDESIPEQRIFKNRIVVVRGEFDIWSTAELAEQFCKCYSNYSKNEYPNLHHCNTLTMKGKNSLTNYQVIDDIISNFGIAIGSNLGMKKVCEAKQLLYGFPLFRIWLKNSYPNQFDGISQNDQPQGRSLEDQTDWTDLNHRWKFWIQKIIIEAFERQKTSESLTLDHNRHEKLKKVLSAPPRILNNDDLGLIISLLNVEVL